MAQLNLHTILRFWATRWPDRLALTCRGIEVSWGELDRRSDEIAAGLAREGVMKGDRVGILMHNRIEFIATLFGIFKAGASAVLLNVRFTPKEMAYPLQDAGIRLVVTEAAFADVLKATLEEVPGVAVFMIEATERFRDFADLPVAGAAAPEVEVGGADVALVCYTSGTTGFPKGAMLTHGCIHSAGVSGIIPMGITFEDRLLISLPLAYTWGTCQYFREALIPGATTIIESTFDPDRLIEVLEGERITNWASVVVLFEKIANHPRFAEADFSALKHVITGNASLHLLKTWSAKGVPISQAWGLTETGGHATILYAEDAEARMGSSGRAMMGCEVRVVDEDGRTLPPNTPGEVLVRGPIIMKGYLNKPEETAKTIVDGWLHTGDIGVIDADGFLSIVDRSKDMLRSGGLNVYPAELERVLAGVPGLEEFTVIGVPDARWGEVPMVIAHGTRPVDVPALKQRARTTLADYKRPRYLVNYGKPLPRTVSGKVLKRDLRLEFREVPADAILLKD